MQQLDIGTYKGVMLCNRPFEVGISSKTAPISTKGTKDLVHSTVDTNLSNHAKEGYFVCGTVSKPWGSNVVIAEKSRVLSRLSKKNGALSRHKQWLKNMHEEREKRKLEWEEKTKIKEEKKRKFMDIQAKRRAEIRQEENLRTQDEENKPPQNKDTTTQDVKISRPAWSLTESDAENVKNDLEVREEEDLMNFVEDLDFERYCGDMELGVLMKQVKERIHKLQKEKNIDESRLLAVMDSEVAAMRSEMYNSSSGDKHKCSAFEDSETRHDIEDDVRSIAETVRTEGGNSIATIHSRKSMNMLVSKSRDRLQFSSSSNDTGESQLDTVIECTGGEKGLNPPLSITHTEDDGARIAETKSLNKLPFKNRNPAL